MKMFRTAAEMEAIPKIRRPKQVHTTDQIVGQASRNGWTVGITMDDLVGAQWGRSLACTQGTTNGCQGIGWLAFGTKTKRKPPKHQASMDVLAHGQFEAMAVSPLAAGRLNPPDICLIYATPAQMILFINGLQWTGFKKMEWGCVGESSCADSWGAR